MNSTDPPPKAPLIIALLLPVLGILVPLILAEIAVRLFSPRSPARWNDRPQHYFIHENSTTLQDYPHSKEKEPDVFRVAVVGDSFTFAPYMQFDDAFPKRLERWLNLNAEQKKVEVINYGVPAYSTSHEAHVVKRAVEEKADIIIMQITLNDPEIKPYTPTELSRDKNRFGDLDLSRSSLRHSQLFSLIARRLHNRSTRTHYTKKFFDLFEKNNTWWNFTGSWKSITKYSKKHNVPLVAVVFPLFGFEVDDSYPFWPIHQKIDKMLTNLQIPHLDITERFRNIPVERLQVLPGQDFHPNEIAHRIAAEEIYSWLSREKIIPESLFAKLQYLERVGINLTGARYVETP